MRFVKPLVLICGLLCSLSLFGQRSAKDSTRQRNVLQIERKTRPVWDFMRRDSARYNTTFKPRLAVQWVASQNLGHFSTHMVGLEHHLSPKTNLQYAIGVIYNRKVLEIDDTYFANKSGFKSVVKLKFFDRGYREFRTFHALEVFFNHRNYDRTRTFELECGSDCTFFERSTYRIQDNNLGLRVNSGVIAPITQRFYLEMDVAFGIIRRDRSSTDKPENPIREFGRSYLEDQRFTDYGFNLNIKLGYLIK